MMSRNVICTCVIIVMYNFMLIFQNSRKSRTTLILEALSKADLPNLESYHNHSLPPTRTHLLTSFVKLAEKELVFLINWAKNVPGMLIYYLLSV